MTDNNDAAVSSLLIQARAILLGQHPVPRNQAARAAAVITRQALEASVRELCSGWGIADPRVNMRSKLVVMRFLGDDTTAELAATAWWGLSNACHHHAYELTPTSAEIQHLIDHVARLIELITDNSEGDNGL
jgi:hypothetical protein